MTPPSRADRPGRCPGCGVAGAGDGPPPGAPVASAACRASYGELLARSYADEDYRRVHQLIVDAYAVQHPGGHSRQEVQAVALCLMTLGLFVEDHVDPRQGPDLHKQMVASRPQFSRLDPPPLHRLLTAADVLAAADADEHERLARRWAAQLWSAWARHHDTVRRWTADALGAPADERSSAARHRVRTELDR